MAIDWWRVAFYMVGFFVLPTSGFIIGNLITRGLLFKIIRVFMMRRKGAVLVKVYTVTEPYYVVAKLQGSMAVFSPRNNKLANGEKFRKAIMLQKGTVQRDFWVPYVEFDEDTNNVRGIDWKAVSSSDPALTDGLMKRLAMLKKMGDNKALILIIMVGAALAILIYLAVQVGHLQQAISALNTIPPAVP